MGKNSVKIKGLFFVLITLFSSPLLSQQASDAVDSKAVLCESGLFEDIQDGVPCNPGLVFSSGLGRVVCYTSFDPVVKKTFIYHKYFFRDELSSRVKLTLNPPRWATFSRIQLRETDRGPWRVEITDEEDKLLHVIRFSITD